MNQAKVSSTVSGAMAALCALVCALTTILWSTEAAARNVITYYHNDVLGSAIAATDENGSVIWREQYAPFGQKVEHSRSANGERSGYTGKVTDKASGLVYMNARYYDATLGRFISIDPVRYYEANPHSFGRYTYANNNPLAYTDPTGESPCFGICTITLLALAVWNAYDTASEAVDTAQTLASDTASSGEKVAAVGLLAAGVIDPTPGNLGRRGVRAIGAGIGNGAKATIDPKKFDYLFGRSTSSAHNAPRSNQLALEMKRLGISDTSAGRGVLSSHLDDVVRRQGNILRTFRTKHGSFEVRDSLLFGPSGKATRLESTFEIMLNGTRRFVTTIPKR